MIRRAFDAWRCSGCVRAQQGERVRRIGVLMSLPADDPEAPARVTAIAQGLQELGWTVGRNLRALTIGGARAMARKGDSSLRILVG